MVSVPSLFLTMVWEGRASSVSSSSSAQSVRLWSKSVNAVAGDCAEMFEAVSRRAVWVWLESWGWHTLLVVTCWLCVCAVVSVWGRDVWVATDVREVKFAI